MTTKFAQSELDSAKQKAGYHRDGDTLPLLVCRSVAQTQTSDKQKTHPNPLGFEYELYGGELGTRTPDPLRVMQVL